MCGFVGFTGEIDKREAVLDAMLQRIVHRGPDMGGTFFGDGITMGFRRLSIQDLSEAGKQPMFSDDGQVAITFNGEIYNFPQLRPELEAAGFTFHSGTDTECLLHGYELWGESVVDHLRGMFAFVIWDGRKRLLFGARDFFGIKPFYWTKTAQGDLLYGSEIKSFLDHPGFIKEVNPDAIRPYLTLQSPMIDETFFKGVYKLPAAHCFTYNLVTGEMNIRRFWDCDFATDGPGTFKEYVDACDAVVHESVEAHRIADVKVASFLSGGVDSSYITACLMPQHTFSVGFDYKNFNETNYAADLSERLGIRNYRKLITADEFFDILPTVQYHMDEPQSNLSSIPLWFLAEMAAEHVTVVLSGEGADELFAGYAWYEDSPAMATFKKLPFGLRRALGRAVLHLPYFKGHNFLVKCAEMPEHYFVGQALVFADREIDEVLQPEYAVGRRAIDVAGDYYARVQDKDELSKKQYVDMNMWLPGDILLKADKMTMAHSLELRVPFLDKRVMEFAQGVPARFRVNAQGNKQVLRHAANRILPDEWATRPKVGFPVPFVYWLREEKYYNYVREYFQAPWAAQFFKPEKLMELLDAHYNGTDDAAPTHRKVYTILTFLIWYKRFFIDEP